LGSPMTYRCHTPIHPVAWRLHLPNLPDPALPCKLQGSLSVLMEGNILMEIVI
jgi:hypothetical protein